MTTQWWRWYSTALVNSAVQFAPVQGGGATLFVATTEANAQQPAPAAGNLLTIKVNLSAAPNTGNSYLFELSINGTPNATLAVTISDAATSGTATGTVAIAAGDLLTIKYTPTSTPDVVNAEVWLEFDPTTANQFAYMGGAGINLETAAGAVAHTFPLFAGSMENVVGTDSTHHRSAAPMAGTIRALFVSMATAPGAGKSWDFVLNKNSTEEASSVINIADTAKTGNVTGLSIAVAKGDTLSFKIKAANSTPASTRAINFGVIFEPTAAGLFAIGSTADNGGQSNSAVYYGMFGKADYTFDMSATETSFPLTIPATLYVSGLTVEAAASPGSGNTNAFLLRKNIGDGTTTLTLADAEVTKSSVTAEDALIADDVIDLQVTPASTPIVPGNINYAIVLGPSQASMSIAPNPIVIPIVISAPVVSHALTISPTPVAIPIVIPAPSILGNQVISPSPVTISIIIPAPAVTQNFTISPTPIAIPIVIPAPTLGVGTYQAYQSLTRLLNPNDWGGSPTLILEIHAFTDDAGSPINAHLYNITDSAVVSGSQISSANTSLDRLRSGSFSLAAGSKEYEVRYGGVSGATYTVEDAVLIVAP